MTKLKITNLDTGVTKLPITCTCGEPITPSQAAQVLRAGRKTNLTSEQAKKMGQKSKRVKK